MSTEREDPQNVTEEVNNAADAIGDIITGKVTLRSHAEELLGRAVDGLFGARKSPAPAALPATSPPALTVHNGGKCT